MKIRLGFNSVNTIHRQLLLTIDANTTPDFDWGYDALVYEFQIDDMYWLINNDKYVIQSTNEINNQSIIPIGIITKKNGLNNITIDNLENVPSDLKIYVHDKELNIYHDLRSSNYDINLTAGEYLNRFEITFSNSILNIEYIENKDINVLAYFSNSNKNVVLYNPFLLTVESIEIYNILGQSVNKFKKVSTKSYSEFETKINASGTYIIKLETENGTLTKKVLVD